MKLVGEACSVSGLSGVAVNQIQARPWWLEVPIMQGKGWGKAFSVAARCKLLRLGSQAWSNCYMEPARSLLLLQVIWAAAPGICHYMGGTAGQQKVGLETASICSVRAAPGPCCQSLWVYTTQRKSGAHSTHWFLPSDSAYDLDLAYEMGKECRDSMEHRNNDGRSPSCLHLCSLLTPFKWLSLTQDVGVVICVFECCM